MPLIRTECSALDPGLVEFICDEQVPVEHHPSPRVTDFLKFKQAGMNPTYYKGHTPEVLLVVPLIGDGGWPLEAGNCQYAPFTSGQLLAPAG